MVLAKVNLNAFSSIKKRLKMQRGKSKHLANRYVSEGNVGYVLMMTCGGKFKKKLKNGTIK